MAAKRKTKKAHRVGRKQYVITGVVGPMKHHAFFGVRCDKGDAVRIANEQYLHTGKRAIVLEVDKSGNGTTEVFRSNG
jgi:hypothetical protein